MRPNRIATVMVLLVNYFGGASDLTGCLQFVHVQGVVQGEIHE